MAVVFLAEDRKHGRRVAIKVLRPELAVTLGPERFLREINIAARLQHPHIVPLFDSGRTGDGTSDASDDSTGGVSGSGTGLLYYVMPYVEGESLRDRLDRAGPLAVGEALRIAGEVASALEHAHRQGIVHRDIKPGNILLSDGHAVVADFGIARALTAAGGGLTQAGLAIGTPSYMSPEQAAGDLHEIDSRTDVYSLGSVLYEMLTGKAPYEGPNYRAVVSQVLSGDVPRVRVVRPEVTTGTERVVMRALAKDPADRFPSAGELGLAVREQGGGSWTRASRRRYLVPAAVALLSVAVVGTWWLRDRGSAPVAADAQVMAVLPFNASGAGLDYLREGMVDLLSANLGGVGGIRTVDPRTVLSRWRARARDGTLDLRSALNVGRSVDAASVLLGSVVSAGAGVRLSAELYTVEGVELASASVDGPADSVLALVDSLSLAVMKEIWRSREPVPAFRLAGVTTGSLDAIQAYLEGEQHYRQSQWESAVGAFGRALDADSTFALASFRLGLVYGWTAGFGADSARKYSGKAARQSERLPPRERSLVAGNALFEAGRVSAVDTMRAYVARYPDDIDGWFLLADAQYHAQPLLALSYDALLAPFDRLLELDASLTPALIHPLELTVIYGDRERFARYLDLLRRNPGGVEATLYETVDAVRWSEAELSGDRASRLLAEPNARGVLTGAVQLTGGSAVDSLVAGFERARGRLAESDARWRQLFQQEVSLLVASGRLRQARRALETLAASYPDQASTYELMAGLAGYPTWSPMGGWDSAATARDTYGAAFAYFASLQGLATGDVSAARRAVGRADSLEASPTWRALLQGVDGWLQIVGGDTTPGIDAMDRALLRAGYSASAVYLGAPLRLQVAIALSRDPATREEGLDRLENDWFLWHFTPFTFLELGKAYEAAGDLGEAAHWYDTLLNVWRGADAELRLLLDDLRRRLMLVSTEPM
jgi:serine/threonine-protein kinase